MPIKDINELDVDTNVGSITVTGDDVTDCNITAEITVKANSEEKARKLAEEVKIEFQSSNGQLGIKVRKPDSLTDRALVANFKKSSERVKFELFDSRGKCKCIGHQRPNKGVNQCRFHHL